MSAEKWTAADIPDQSGRVAVVTGANSGLGYETAKALAGKGAEVIMAVRRPESGREAQSKIQRAYSDSKVTVMDLDLASLKSIEEFAISLRERTNRLDLLINNAGVMALPFQKTADGFEMQLGINHFGHFALTGRLLDLLEATADSRIVTVSSGLHRSGTMDFDNLNWEEGYDPWGAYGRSKVANLLFTYELNRRLNRAGKQTISTAAHPGYAATNLQTKAGSWLARQAMKVTNFLLAQPAAKGALPQLRAATDPQVQGGDYYGPNGMQESKGDPVKVDSNELSKDETVAKRLWEVSEELTGVRYDWFD